MFVHRAIGLPNDSILYIYLDMDVSTGRSGHKKNPWPVITAHLHRFYYFLAYAHHNKSHSGLENY